MRSFRDNNRFMFFYDVLGISLLGASIYREFCVVLSSFVFDVTLISVGRILTADQIVCRLTIGCDRRLTIGCAVLNTLRFLALLYIKFLCTQANDWLGYVSSGKQTVIKSR
jgi:hypothetical protein